MVKNYGIYKIIIFFNLCNLYKNNIFDNITVPKNNKLLYKNLIFVNKNMQNVVLHYIFICDIMHLEHLIVWVSAF